MKKGLLYTLCFLAVSCNKYEYYNKDTAGRNKFAGYWHIDSCHWRTTGFDSDSIFQIVLTKDFFDVENRPFFVINQVLDDKEFSIPCTTNFKGYDFSFYTSTNYYSKNKKWNQEEQTDFYFIPTDRDYDPGDSIGRAYYKKFYYGQFTVEEHIRHKKLTMCKTSYSSRGPIKDCIYLSQ